MSEVRSDIGTLIKWLQDYHELTINLLKFEHPADREHFYRRAEVMIAKAERAAEERLLEDLSNESEYAEKDLASGGSLVFECIPMSAIQAKRQALHKTEEKQKGEA